MTIQNSMFMAPTCEEEVYNILKNLKTNKSPGIDGIRPKDLKFNSSIITPVITTFINSSIDSGIIPKLLKTSLIHPIYKNGT